MQAWFVLVDRGHEDRAAFCRGDARMRPESGQDAGASRRIVWRCDTIQHFAEPVDVAEPTRFLRCAA